MIEVPDCGPASMLASFLDRRPCLKAETLKAEMLK
jgi:ribosomal protein S27AE